MRHKLNQSMLTCMTIALVVTIAGGCSLLPKEESTLRPPLVKPVKENYSTIKVEIGTIAKEVKGTGTFESTSMEYAQFKDQGGRIDKLYVKSGDKVKKGDVLVQLSFDGLDLRLKEQELSLERAKYGLDMAKEKEAQDPRAVKIAAMQVDIEQIKYNKLLQALNSKQLTAGINGQVTFVEALSPGDMINSYQTLVIVADPAKLRFMVQPYNASDIPGVVIGMTAEVKTKSETVTGKIVQTPSSAPHTQNKELAEKYSKMLVVDFDKLPSDAGIGNSGDVTIVTDKHADVLKIPRRGLRSYFARQFVQVLEGEALRDVDVEVGLQTATDVEITKGLTEGQIVVLQ